MADRYTVIKNEILTDPASVGYVGKDASSQAVLMDTPLSQSPPVFANGKLNPQQIVEVLIRRVKWKGIVDVVGSNANAFYFVELMKLSNIPVDPADPAIQTLVGNLVTAGLLASADITALKALYQTEVKLSRADVLGLGIVSQGDVEKSRTV